MTRFHRDVLRLDSAAETDRVVGHLRRNVFDVLRRDGRPRCQWRVDSAVALALAVRAFGSENRRLLLPERGSSPTALALRARSAGNFACVLSWRTLRQFYSDSDATRVVTRRYAAYFPNTIAPIA